jgi:mannose-6-phosphate isomerase-like protein (cupin superfamily)
MSGTQVTFKKALASLPKGERYAEVIQHGSMSAGVYAPHSSDEQTMNDRDKMFVVMSGTGFFRIGEDRRPFTRGDLLFVTAGTEHQFEGFTPDFSVWAFHWGPEPSEAA